MLPWPTDVEQNLAHRRDTLRAAAKDEGLQQGLNDYAAENPIWWVNGFAWTFNPDLPIKTIPFILYPFQERCYLDLHGAIQAVLDSDGALSEDRLIDKSRKMGATWLILILYLHWWLFQRESMFLCMSRNEDLVDKTDNPDCLFAKLDLAISCLPPWMTPGVKRNHMHIGNQDNGSSIDGAPTTGDVARGGRRLSIMLDEWGAMVDAAEALRSTRDATGCRIFNSTPKGAGTEHHKMRMRGKTKVTIFHWSEHPQKQMGLYTTENGKVKVLDDRHFLIPGTDGKWFPEDYKFRVDEEGKKRSVIYDIQEDRCNSPKEMAQEWDINHLASGSTYFDSQLIWRLIQDGTRPPLARYDVQYTILDGEDADHNPTREVVAPSLVESTNGSLLSWVELGEWDAWRAPRTTNYGMGIDISGGAGASNSVVSIVDVETGIKVAEFANPLVDHVTFGEIAVALGMLFGGHGGHAYMIWEQNGGLTFGREVLRLGYGNYYMQRREQSKNPETTENDVPGWHNNTKSKKIALGEYQRSLKLGHFKNLHEHALMECFDYIYLSNNQIGVKENKADDPAGAKDAHGDRVIADALACKTLSEHLKAPKKPKRCTENSMAERKMLREAKATSRKEWSWQSALSRVRR